mmetsp:Transcript_41436/g.95277  ORF Transcript_41436/g.95277 Transcript_41436/m.95277 type:complete len:221 (+) Transcript_41436:90-752(+)
MSFAWRPPWRWTPWRIAWRRIGPRHCRGWAPPWSWWHTWRVLRCICFLACRRLSSWRHPSTWCRSSFAPDTWRHTRRLESRRRKRRMPRAPRAVSCRGVRAICARLQSPCLPAPLQLFPAAFVIRAVSLVRRSSDVRHALLGSVTAVLTVARPHGSAGTGSVVLPDNVVRPSLRLRKVVVTASEVPIMMLLHIQPNRILMASRLLQDHIQLTASIPRSCE